MRLLLAEDERELSNALVTVLKHNNYSVDAVYNGQDALDFLREGGYDGAILDIMMPRMDGLTVLKTIREEGLELPVLLLTARSEVEDRISGLDTGADDYLTKPFAMGELLARIRSMTRRRAGLTGTVLSFGNASLDRASYMLRGPKGELRLSGREFQMLEMLMVNPRVLISTERFMEKVWGYDSEAEINVVWVYISSLRKKLAAIGANVAIRAVRGAGYNLEENND